MARYHRQIGDDTYFLTGSDDNSLTNVRAAELEGIPVAELVARNTESFIELDRLLNISYDQYIRTSVDERHLRGSQKLWKAVEASGDIYKQDYFGLYCPNCELFYDADELVDGLCPEHLIRPEEVQESNYFFRLSRYQDRLEALISSDTYRVIPEHRKNEVLSFIRSGLRDFSISRSYERARGWGIPVPGDEKQVMYVWFDALSNYITALGYADEDDLYRRYWLENDRRTHAIGKGIIRFHAVYWPAMLMSAGVPVPTALFVHGYYTVEGQKMSKSLGNSIDPVDMVRRYGTDALRYFFLAATPPTGDTDFSIEAFESRYNADLANDLGNLVNRTVSMIGRYREGVVPEGASQAVPDREIGERAEHLKDEVGEAMRALDFQGALDGIWEVISRANKYIEQQAPWKLNSAATGEGPESVQAGQRLDAVLFTLAETLRLISLHLEPFVPETAAKMRQQLGLESGAGVPRWGEMPAGTHVSKPEPIFPRLEASRA
jgi:methionyl-tRNA synthetase